MLSPFIRYHSVMPAAEQFTPSFVQAFITRCFERGLTKEATTYLLELSAISAAHKDPGFAAGFNEKMSEGGLEKSAWARMGKLLTGGLVAGGAGMGAYQALKNRNREVWGDVPLYGVYDRASAAAGEQSALDAASKGIAELNRNTDRDGKRRYELQQVVDAGGPGAAAAIAELQNLRRVRPARARMRYGQELDQYNTHVNRGLNTVENEISDLNGSRGSLWNRTRNFFGMGRDFNAEERELVAQQARLAEQARLSQRLRDRLRSGATSWSNGVPTNEEMQQRFFPTR